MSTVISAGNATTGLSFTPDNAGTFEFKTGTGAGTTAIYVDASQNVGVGTTSPRLVAGYTTLGINNTTGGFTDIFAANTRVASFGADATSTYVSAVASAPLLFSTGNTERARIDSSGNLLVGTTSVTGLVTSSQAATSAPSVAARATSTSFANDVVQIYCARDTNNNSYNYILASRPAGVSFVVRDSGNVQNANNSYGSLSDQRLKENIVDATPKLEKLNQVRIVNFNMIGDNQKQIGVIAQELEQIFPNMVEEDQEGTKSVKYSVFVPMLIKAIQELKAELDAVKAKVGA